MNHQIRLIDTTYIPGPDDKSGEYTFIDIAVENTYTVGGPLSGSNYPNGLYGFNIDHYMYLFELYKDISYVFDFHTESILTDDWVSEIHVANMYSILPSSCTLLNKGYVIGGQTDIDGSVVTNSVFVFDPVYRAWSRMSDALYNHSTRPCIFVYNDTIYVAGGDNQNSSPMEKYNYGTNEWTDCMTSGLGANIRLGTAQCVDHYGYIMGDYNFVYNRSIIKYDTITETMELTSPKIESKWFDNGISFVIDREIFVGNTSDEGLEIYDVDTNIWRTYTNGEAPSTLHPHRDTVTHTYNGVAYIFGSTKVVTGSGDIGNNIEKTIETPFVKYVEPIAEENNVVSNDTYDLFSNTILIERVPESQDYNDLTSTYLTKIDNNTVRIVKPSDNKILSLLIKDRLYVKELYKYIGYMYNGAVFSKDFLKHRSIHAYVRILDEDPTDYNWVSLLHGSGMLMSHGSNIASGDRINIDGVLFNILDYSTESSYNNRYSINIVDISVNNDIVHTAKISVYVDMQTMFKQIVGLSKTRLVTNGNVPPELNNVDGLSRLDTYYKYAYKTIADMSFDTFVDLLNDVTSTSVRDSVSFELLFDSDGELYIPIIAQLFSNTMQYSFEVTIKETDIIKDRFIDADLVKKFELPDENFDTVFLKTNIETINNKHVSGIHMKQAVILEKSDDDVIWTPLSHVSMQSEESISDIIKISIPEIKTIDPNVETSSILCRYIKLETPIDFMIGENIVDKYLLLNGIYVKDIDNNNVSYTLNSKHATEISKNGIVIDDDILLETLQKYNVLSTVQLKTDDTVSLILDLGSELYINNITVYTGDASRRDPTQFKFNISYGTTIDNMNIVYEHDATTNKGRTSVSVQNLEKVPKFSSDGWVSLPPL